MSLLNWIFGVDDDAKNSTEPTINIDGSPMCGDVDINGNPYGVTEISDCSSSMDDSFTSMDSSCGFDDSFSSFDDW